MMSTSLAIRYQRFLVLLFAMSGTFKIHICVVARTGASD